MNAAQENPNPTDALIQGPRPVPSRLDASGLSALVDGELGAQESQGWLAECGRSDDAMATWHAYQVVGEVLRGQALRPVAQAPSAFLAGIHARLDAEAAPAVVPVQPVQPVLVAPPATVAGHVRAPAANDAVFRWKLMAGVASLAAVMAVSWVVVQGTAATGVAGPQMALVSPVAPVGNVVASNEVATVVVNTGQGPVIRDPRLEELMAEHRQYGGMSALQMPAGFMRNATYDAAPQR